MLYHPVLRTAGHKSFSQAAAAYNEHAALLLEIKPTNRLEAGCAMEIELTAAANPSHYKAHQNVGWVWEGQADAMFCVEPQFPKVCG